jgi:hypothetical protein
MGYVGCVARVSCSFLGQLCVTQTCCVIAVLRVAQCMSKIPVVGPAQAWLQGPLWAHAAPPPTETGLTRAREHAYTATIKQEVAPAHPYTDLSQGATYKGRPQKPTGHIYNYKTRTSSQSIQCHRTSITSKMTAQATQHQGTGP